MQKNKLKDEQIKKSIELYQSLTDCLDWVAVQLINNNIAPREFIQHWLKGVPSQKWLQKKFEKFEKEEMKKKK